MRSVVAAVAAMVLVCTSSSFAQTRGMGRFAGTVVDDSGSPVEGVKIVAKLETNGGVVEQSSDAKGVWAVAGIGRGTWRVEFHKPGFTPVAAKVILESELAKVPALKIELKKS